MSGNKRYLCGCLASGSGGDPLPGYCPDHPILFRGQSLRAATAIMLHKSERVSLIADALMDAFYQGVAAAHITGVECGDGCAGCLNCTSRDETVTKDRIR